jgi:hypothetical protein
MESRGVCGVCYGAPALEPTGKDAFLHDSLAKHGLAACGIVGLLAGGLAGCSGPSPVLYPNSHYQTVGKATAERDIEDCRRMADQAGASSGTGQAESAAGGAVAGGAIGGAAGAAGGAIAGAAGTGAAIGAASGAAAGLVRSLFRSDGPSQAYRNVVNRCLRERGYEPVGWD